jgi:CRP-like cAMP-binding protein
VGQCLEKLKKLNRAYEVYRALAWHCLKAGYPLLGLDATKRAERLQAGFQGTLEAVAELYGLESERVDQDLALLKMPELSQKQTVDQQVAEDDRLPATAEALAKNFQDARYPSQVPPVPLFSLLAREAFFPILEILELHTYEPGEVIVKEGDPGKSIYLLAHGEVEVHEGHDEDSRTLARLVSGSVFGEMALITDAPRVASAVAIRECDILEIRPEDLEAAAEDLDDITWAMAKFTRQRFLNYLMVTSPVFSQFAPEEKKEIFDRFTSVGVPTDDVVIREGTAGPGLYLILGGEVEVSKFEGDSRVHLANLKEGSVFGEISLVRDTPTTATVKAVRGGEFLFLSREDFNELVAERPGIREALAKLTEERLAEQRQAIEDAGIISRDGSVIF